MATIKKSQLIEEIAETCNLPPETIGTVITACEEAISKHLADGDDVNTPIMTFVVKHVPARNWRNPQTGEAVPCPAHNRVAVKIAKPLRDAVSNTAQ